MNSYLLWGLIRRTAGQKFEVRARAIALRGNALAQPGDSVSQTCATFEEATRVRDELVAQLNRAVTDRGDKVISIDSTLEL